MYQFGREKYAHIADGFRANKNNVKEIFVDETLIQINGQDYCWLWVAYEPNLDTCLMVHIYIKRESNFCVLSIF